MRFTVVTMGVAALAVGMLAARVEAKSPKVDHPSHSGTFVSAGGGKLLMTGRNGKEHTHPVAKDVKVTIDGKPAAYAGLKKGMQISVTTDKSGNATAIATVTARPTTAAKATAAAKPAATAKPAGGCDPGNAGRACQTGRRPLVLFPIRPAPLDEKKTPGRLSTRRLAFCAESFEGAPGYLAAWAVEGAFRVLVEPIGDRLEVGQDRRPAVSAALS